MKDPLMMPSDEVSGLERPAGVGEVAGANISTSVSVSAVVEVCCE